MSLTTDARRFVRRGRRGTVLMEFVIVLPIYMVLLSTIFLWGDMGLKAVILAFGDMCVTVDGTDHVGYSYSKFADKSLLTDGLSAATRKDYRVDRSVKGSWSAQYAGRTGYTYKIYSWMDGIMGYPLSIYGNASPGIVETLAGGGSVLLDGKGMERKRMYNNYILRRTELARSPSVCRNWKSDALLGRSDGKRGWEWSRDELYADPNAKALEGSDSSQDTLPSPRSLGKYRRYGQYDSWTE